MLSVVSEESISIMDIRVEFQKIKIPVKESAVYNRVRRMEDGGLIQRKNREFSRKGRVGMGPLEYFLTEKGLVERDALNADNPPPPKPDPVKEIPGTKKLSVEDYLQMPVIKPLE